MFGLDVDFCDTGLLSMTTLPLLRGDGCTVLMYDGGTLGDLLEYALTASPLTSLVGLLATGERELYRLLKTF